VISLAGVDLVYVGLDVILTSVETALRHMGAASQGAKLAEARTARPYVKPAPQGAKHN
jgi:hypothetical protein